MIEILLAILGFILGAAAGWCIVLWVIRDFLKRH